MFLLRITGEEERRIQNGPRPLTNGRNLCPEIQSDLMQEIQGPRRAPFLRVLGWECGCGEKRSPAWLCNLPMTCLKNLCTFAFRVCGHPAVLRAWRNACLDTRGAVTGPVCFLILSGLLFHAGALFNVRASRSIPLYLL